MNENEYVIALVAGFRPLAVLGLLKEAYTLQA